MNDESKDLDQFLNCVLSDQDSISDQGFTDQVLRSLPHRGNQKLRGSILLGSISLGSLAAFFVMGGNKTEILREMFKGFSTYQASGLAMILGVTLFYSIFFFSTQEELN